MENIKDHGNSGLFRAVYCPDPQRSPAEDLPERDVARPVENQEVPQENAGNREEFVFLYVSNKRYLKWPKG